MIKNIEINVARYKYLILHIVQFMESSIITFNLINGQYFNYIISKRIQRDDIININPLLAKILDDVEKTYLAKCDIFDMILKKICDKKTINIHTILNQLNINDSFDQMMALYAISLKLSEKIDDNIVITNIFFTILSFLSKDDFIASVVNNYDYKILISPTKYKKIENTFSFFRLKNIFISASILCSGFGLYKYFR